jgi:hypothetical protein
MNNIVDPLTGELYSLLSIQGKTLLKKYIKLYQSGGAEEPEKEGGAGKGPGEDFICKIGEGCCGTVDKFKCQKPPLFEKFLETMKKEQNKTEWSKHMIYVLEHYGYRSFFELFGLGNSWRGLNANMNCPWLVYDRLFSEFLKPNELMYNYLKRRGQTAEMWFKRRRLTIATLSIMAIVGTKIETIPLVLWLVDRIRYEGVINGYLPLSGYIDDGIIRTKILNTHTIQNKVIQFDTIKSYNGPKHILYEILNKSYNICFGPNTFDKEVDYMMTHIDGYGPLHFCSIDKPPAEYHTFPGHCIYNVCKVTNAVKIKGGCKILIQNVLKRMFDNGDEQVCLLVRINTDIRFPYTINYPAIRCYLQSGFRFINTKKELINKDFDCDGDFESFKNKLRSYIFKQRKTLLQIERTDGLNALMVCKKQKQFRINNKINIEVTSALPSNNSDVKYTFKSNGIDIPYYDDVYGINPEVFHVNDVKVNPIKVEMPISPRSMNAKSIRKIQKKNPGKSIKDFHSLNQTESRKLRTEQHHMIRRQKRFDQLACKRELGSLKQVHDDVNFCIKFETIKNNIITIMKKKMGQGPPLMCEIPTFIGSQYNFEHVTRSTLNNEFVKDTLMRFFEQNKYNVKIDTEFFNNFIENIKSILKNIELKCTFPNKNNNNIGFSEKKYMGSFIKKTNIITNDEKNIEELKNLFDVYRGIPFILCMTRHRSGGHVTWAIKLGNVPIIICRQQANANNCPVIFGYKQILEYMIHGKYNNAYVISNILDTCAPMKFGNLYVVSPVATYSEVYKLIEEGGKSSSTSASEFPKSFYDYSNVGEEVYDPETSLDSYGDSLDSYGYSNVDEVENAPKPYSNVGEVE